MLRHIWFPLSLLVLALAVALAGCGDNGPPTLPCWAPSDTARLDVETCVDHQDVAICRWADPDITTPDHVVDCVAPGGVVCVQDCPPNHYADGGTP